MQSSMERTQLEHQAAAALELKRRKSAKKTVFGIVCPEKGFLYSITKKDNEWTRTKKAPDIYIAKKFEPVDRFCSGTGREKTGGGFTRLSFQAHPPQKRYVP